MFLIFLLCLGLDSCVFIGELHLGLDVVYHLGCKCVMCCDCDTKKFFVHDN
jgi:hypothetical protein